MRWISVQSLRYVLYVNPRKSTVLTVYCDSVGNIKCVTVTVLLQVAVFAQLQFLPRADRKQLLAAFSLHL